jgi:hypothetical protein
MLQAASAAGSTKIINPKEKTSTLLHSRRIIPH